MNAGWRQAKTCAPLVWFLRLQHGDKIVAEISGSFCNVVSPPLEKLEEGLQLLIV